jgi:dethiobiotin synthetase
MPGRPDRTVLVIGTGTDVGKTWVTAALARRLAADGLVVAARKPAQSFAPEDPPEGRDAAVLGEADHPGRPPGRAGVARTVFHRLRRDGRRGALADQ